MRYGGLLWGNVVSRRRGCGAAVCGHVVRWVVAWEAHICHVVLSGDVVCGVVVCGSRGVGLWCVVVPPSLPHPHVLHLGGKTKKCSTHAMEKSISVS